MKIHKEQEPAIMIVTHNRSLLKSYPGRILLCDNLVCKELEVSQEIDFSQLLGE